MISGGRSEAGAAASDGLGSAIRHAGSSSGVGGGSGKSRAFATLGRRLRSAMAELFGTGNGGGGVSSGQGTPRGARG